MHLLHLWHILPLKGQKSPPPLNAKFYINLLLLCTSKLSHNINAMQRQVLIFVREAVALLEIYSIPLVYASSGQIFGEGKAVGDRVGSP